MTLFFDKNATESQHILQLVHQCLAEVKPLEETNNASLIIHQDGKSKGYYIKCTVLAEYVAPLLDMNAKLNPSDADSFRANRELLIEHNTFKRMAKDAILGREFNDIIVNMRNASTSKH
jgi:hypothetical protein